MRTIFTCENKDDDPNSPIVFLAGPTSRNMKHGDLGWRKEAFNICKKNDFDGTLVIPEYAHYWDKLYPDISKCIIPEEQYEWERLWLGRADCILFWIPREMPLTPGLTTNIEFGLWVDSFKIVYGRPDDADNIRYLDWLFLRERKGFTDKHVIIHNNLDDAIGNSIEKSNNCMLRRV